MGAWGFFDDENDTTSDYWDDFTDKFCNKYYKKISNIKENNSNQWEEYYNQLDKIIINNKLKVAKSLIKYINEIESEIETYKEVDIIKSGLIIKLVRFGKVSDKLPKLFDKFPSKLKNIACKSIKNTIENEDNSHWSNINKRLKALDEQYKLFHCKSQKTKKRKHKKKIEKTHKKKQKKT